MNRTFLVWPCDNSPHPTITTTTSLLHIVHMHTLLHTSPSTLFSTDHMTTGLPTGVFWISSHPRPTHPHKYTPKTLTLSHWKQSMGKGGDVTIVPSRCGLCGPHLFPSAQGVQRRPMTGNPVATSAAAGRDLGLQ